MDVVQGAYKILIQYGTFRWSREDDFNITRHEREEFKAFSIQAVKDKRLTKGRWRDKTWVGFVTLSRMVRVFLEHHIQNGALNFDVVMSKCLSVVLIAALGSRSGDVARSDGYKGTEYMQYRHIELYLEAGAGRDHPPRFKDLHATITLEYVKWYKDRPNESTVKYFRPLDTQSIHVCPIAILLVHALRNGLVYGTTLEEVLDHTAAQPDLHVRWKYPDRPVLTAFARTRPIRCELDVVAEARQVLMTMKQMGLVSGMLSRVYAHSLRLGALRDYAHLSKKASNMLPSTDDVRRVAGHTSKSMLQGVTEEYIGDIAQDYYNERAENGGVYHGEEPKFALSGGRAYQETVKQRVSAEEMQAYLDKHNPGQDAATLKGAARRTIQEGVRRQRREALASSAAAEPVTRWTASNAGAPPYPAPAPPPRPAFAQAGVPPYPVPVPLPPSPFAQAGAPSYPAPVPLPRPAFTTPTTSSKGVPPPQPPSSKGVTTSEDLVFLSNVDPALLDEETLASLEVANADVDALQNVIFPIAPEAGTADVDEEQWKEEEGGGVEGLRKDLQDVASEAAIQGSMEEATHILLGQEGPQQNGNNVKHPPPAWTASDDPAVWINGYARYNVVNNTEFASAWRSFSEGQVSFEESIGQHSVRGNSRDEPTPYVFNCQRTEGCNYSAIRRCLIEQHEQSCNVSLVEARSKEMAQPSTNILRCTHAGCTFETSAGEAQLKKHVSRMHGWTPKACEDCDDGVIYQKQGAYETHRTNVHSGRWPSKCLFPGCSGTGEFSSRPTMVYHLKKAHGLLTAEEWNPYLPAATGRKRWLRQKCVVATCTSETLFHSKGHLVVHLTSAHKMTEKDAKELVDRDARMETAVPKTQVLGPGGNARRRHSQRASVVASGKENVPPPALDGVQELPSEHGTAGAVQELPSVHGTAGSDEPKLKKPRAKKT